MHQKAGQSVATPYGPARLAVDLPDTARAVGVLALGHGAGGGVDAHDLLAVRDAGLARGVAVARITQPYRVAGRRAPPPASHLDAAWSAVVEALPSVPGLDGLPLVVGGRSSGARVACRTAGPLGAIAVLCLAFPLHPPGRPDKSRVVDLDVGHIPLLIMQGERDPFGTPGEFPTDVELYAVAGGAHSFARAVDLEPVAQRVAAWVVARLSAVAQEG